MQNGFPHRTGCVVGLKAWFYQAPWKGRDRVRAVRVAVYCFLDTDAALMECLQLRGPSRLAVPGLTAVTILETGQGPGQ